MVWKAFSLGIVKLLPSLTLYSWFIVTPGISSSAMAGRLTRGGGAKAASAPPISKLRTKIRPSLSAAVFCTPFVCLLASFRCQQVTCTFSYLPVRIFSSLHFAHRPCLPPSFYRTLLSPWPINQGINQGTLHRLVE